MLCSRPPRVGAQSRAVESSPGHARPDHTNRDRSPPASSPSSCRAPSPRWVSNPSGRTRPASGATASTRCARTSRASPRRLAHAFIARYSRPGDVVLDPFSGRGTAPLQAAAEGRIGVGNDLNPLAHVLTAAKLDPAMPAEARTRLAALRIGWAGDAAGLARSRTTRSGASRSPVGARAGRGFARRAGGARRARPRRGCRRLPPADAGAGPVRALTAAARRSRGPVPRGRA